MNTTAHHHHQMPTSGGALMGVALSATLHCLTGCAIGEILGVVIGTALGFSDFATIALAIALAFLFGYALTSLPLLRAGFALAAVVPIALASDTASIAVMEIVDNAILLIIPGAMEAGVGDVLFWGSLSVALVVAGAFALPLNRWLIARGKGHAVVHETGVHGGPSPRVVGAIAVVAAVFGTVVLVDEFVSSDEGADHGAEAAEQREGAPGGAGAGEAREAEAAPLPGPEASAGGLTFELATTRLDPGERGELRFQIVGEDGRPVRDFQVQHDKRLHLILVRRDLIGFQHLHPRMAPDGTWTTPVTIDEPGEYRLFADFKREGRGYALARDLTVTGAPERVPLAPPSATAVAGSGYTVVLDLQSARAGEQSELTFWITRADEVVAVEDYLGAKGHLVALRARDLEYLHTHPTTGGAHAGHAGHGGAALEAVTFHTEFPSAGRHRLFMQFKHEGRVHTAAFTLAVTG
jgi:Domain of unknown function (DUF4396)